jgi:carbamoylphosphate synthase large subunit
MNVIFVEPAFPANQQQFVRALHAIGATVIGIGERPREALPDALQQQMIHYHQVGNVCDEPAMIGAVRQIQQHTDVQHMEATVEAHVMTTSRVREACGIPGVSSATAWVCRDKPTMKQVLSEAGVPCAQSTGTDSTEEALEFARRVGYPLIVKPRDGAGAAGTSRVDDDTGLQRALAESGVGQGASVALEEFIEGHEGFYDTITVGGEVRHDFITHYFPNVLEAMRARWISPQFVTTNRIDSTADYQQVRDMGKRVIEVLEIGNAPTHMEWFFGPKGLKFSEIGCRPPGVGAWDLYSAANDMDLYREWALGICGAPLESRPSRRFSAGIIALRPQCDGRITGYQGLEEIQHRFADQLIDYHLPEPGTPTQGVEAGYMANAWIRMRHSDFDALRSSLDSVGETVQVLAE